MMQCKNKSTSTLSNVILLLYMVSRIVADCPTPPVYDDKTHRNYEDTYSTGDTATYECAPGYFFRSGQTISTCQNDGSWSGVTLHCVLGSCSNPGTPSHGTRSGDDFRVGRQISFSCDEGYRLVGDTVSTCLADITWSKGVPTCSAITCLSLQAPQYGSINPPGEGHYNDVITVKCDGRSGFMYSQTPDTRRCTEDGTWTGTAGTCIETDCGLPTLYNGEVEAPVGTAYAAEIRYKCNDDATMDMSEDLRNSDGYSRCYVTGIWVPPPPTCNLNCNSNVPVVTRGSISTTGATSYPHGTTLNINCSPGFTHKDAEHVTCNNGTWVPNEGLSCVLIPTTTTTKAPVRPDTTHAPTDTPPTSKEITQPPATVRDQTESPEADVRPDTTHTPTDTLPTSKEITQPPATVRDQTESPEPDGFIGLSKLAIGWISSLAVSVAGLFTGIVCCNGKRKQVRNSNYEQERKYRVLCDEVKRILQPLPEKMSGHVKSNFEKLRTLIEKAELIDKKQNENLVNTFIADTDSRKAEVEKEEYRDLLKLLGDDLKWVEKEDCTAYMDERKVLWLDKKRYIEGKLRDGRGMELKPDVESFHSMEKIHNALMKYVLTYHPTGLLYDDPPLTVTRRYLILGMFPCCEYTGTIKRKHDRGKVDEEETFL